MSNLEGEREGDDAVPSAGKAGAQCPAARKGKAGKQGEKGRSRERQLRAAQVEGEQFRKIFEHMNRLN